MSSTTKATCGTLFEQLRQIAAGLKLHPFHTVRALKITRSVNLKLLDVILLRQRSVGGDTNVMVAEFRHN
jgi:hypothetical protein